MLKLNQVDRQTGMVKLRFFFFLLIAFFALCSLGSNPLLARQTFPDQARNVVKGWLSINPTPLGTDFRSKKVGYTETFYHQGAPLYYVVYLLENNQERGLVIVSAEDRIEPIIAFFPDARDYDPSTANPAGALVENDLKNRMQIAIELPEYKRESSKNLLDLSSNPQKWEYLESIDPQIRSYSGESTVGDIRVSPLVQSKWNQGDADGGLCYNYYTPENYVCGCVATAFAQLMLYHKHPTDGVGTQDFKGF